jgi:hypothetical protein
MNTTKVGEGILNAKKQTGLVIEYNRVRAMSIVRADEDSSEMYRETAGTDSLYDSSFGLIICARFELGAMKLFQKLLPKR